MPMFSMGTSPIKKIFNFLKDNKDYDDYRSDFVGSNKEKKAKREKNEKKKILPKLFELLENLKKKSNKKEYDINKRFNNNLTILHLAALRRYTGKLYQLNGTETTFLKEILDQGADPNAEDEKSFTPLLYADGSDSYNSIKKKYYNYNRRYIKNIKIIFEKMIKSPETREEILKNTILKKLSIFIKRIFSSVETPKQLAKRFMEFIGCIIKVYNDKGPKYVDNILLIELLKKSLLIEKRFKDMKIKCFVLVSELLDSEALDSEHTEYINVIRESININQIDNHGNTVLHILSQFPLFDGKILRNISRAMDRVIELIKRNNIKNIINKRNNNNKTPLHIALETISTHGITEKRINFIKFLINKGATVDEEMSKIIQDLRKNNSLINEQANPDDFFQKIDEISSILSNEKPAAEPPPEEKQEGEVKRKDAPEESAAPPAPAALPAPAVESEESAPAALPAPAVESEESAPEGSGYMRSLPIIKGGKKSRKTRKRHKRHKSRKRHKRHKSRKRHKRHKSRKQKKSKKSKRNRRRK